MSAHTNPQVIIQNGRPAFAVVPWDEYQKLISNQASAEPDVWFPNEVVKSNARGDVLIKAWREYLGLTQAELADRAGIRQPALARLEKGGASPRKATLTKLAQAMDITVEQLIE